MPKKTTVAPKSSWDLLGDDNWKSKVKESMLSSKNNRSRILSEVDDVRSKMLKIPEFGLQATFNTFGFIHGRMIDILATDGIGKTTLLFTFAGWCMAQGSPTYYQETENKPMAPDRIKRCLSTNRALAEKLYDRLVIDPVFDIQTSILNMENFVLRARDPDSPAFVPKHIPLILMQDTFSKLMDPNEAEGVLAYATEGGKVSDAKEVGGGSNFVASKLMHAWSRRLPAFLEINNCILIFARHQNDKVDMSAGRFGGGSVGDNDSRNRTSRGGKAFNQNSALQLILSRIQAISAKVNGVDEKVGVKGQINVVKNSYGPGDRKFYFQINTIPRTDTEDYQEPAVTFAPYTAEWLFNKKLLAMSMKNKNCYTCKELDVYDATAEEFHVALHKRTDVMERIGKRLEIYGYGSSCSAEPPVQPEAAEPAPAADQAAAPIDDPAETPLEGNVDDGEPISVAASAEAATPAPAAKKKKRGSRGKKQ